MPWGQSHANKLPKVDRSVHLKDKQKSQDDEEEIDKNHLERLVWCDHELWILGLPLPAMNELQQNDDEEEITVKLQNFAHD